MAAVSFPAASLAPVLDVFADCVLHPAFKRADLERVRALRLGDLAQLEADPAQIGKTVLDRTVWGDQNPWAFPSLGTVASNKAARADQLSAWHRAWVRPNNAVLVVVGDVRPAELMPELERRFGGWAKAALPKRRSLAPAASKGPRVVTVVDRPGAAQSQLWVGELGLGASSTDLYAAQVASTVLGGGFKSRLNANLRSGKGYTYGAYSAFDVRREPGLFVIAAPVVADKTAEALRELLNEIDRLREGGVDASELAEAKSGLIQSLPSEFQTTTSTALAFGTAGRRSGGLAGLLRPVRPEAAGRQPGGRGPRRARTLRHQDALHRGGGSAGRAPRGAGGAGPRAHRAARRHRRGGQGGAGGEVERELMARVGWLPRVIRAPNVLDFQVSHGRDARSTGESPEESSMKRIVWAAVACAALLVGCNSPHLSIAQDSAKDGAVTVPVGTTFTFDAIAQDSSGTVLWNLTGPGIPHRDLRRSRPSTSRPPPTTPRPPPPRWWPRSATRRARSRPSPSPW